MNFISVPRKARSFTLCPFPRLMIVFIWQTVRGTRWVTSEYFVTNNTKILFWTNFSKYFTSRIVIIPLWVGASCKSLYQDDLVGIWIINVFVRCGECSSWIMWKTLPTILRLWLATEKDAFQEVKTGIYQEEEPRHRIHWNIIVRCGDGGPATKAKLSFPKGLAVSVDRSIFISDGKSIRIVHQNGKIDTLLGAHLPTKHLLPLGCDTSYLVSSRVYWLEPERVIICKYRIINSDIKEQWMDHNILSLWRVVRV